MNKQAFENAYFTKLAALVSPFQILKGKTAIPKALIAAENKRAPNIFVNHLAAPEVSVFRKAMARAKLPRMPVQSAKASKDLDAAFKSVQPKVSYRQENRLSRLAASQSNVDAVVGASKGMPKNVLHAMSDIAAGGAALKA